MAFYELSGLRALTTGELTEPRPFQATFEAGNDRDAAGEALRRRDQHAGLRYTELALSRLDRTGRVAIPL